MSVKIHPSAIVEKGAELGEGVEIGPFSIIGSQVRIGAGTRVYDRVTITGYTEIGARCEIHSGACLGNISQVRKVPARAYLKIGSDNLIREYVTMNPGMKEEAATLVGDKNFIMIGAHIAHDCRLGSEITIANQVGLAGHVTIEDKVTIGGMVGIHQFVRVGRLAMVGGLSKVVMDVPPFVTCDGHPARYYGINALGLKRAGVSAEEMRAIRQALNFLLASGKRLSSALTELEDGLKQFSQVRMILDFISESRRGVIRSRRGRIVEAVED